MTFFMRKRWGLMWAKKHPPIPWRGTLATVLALTAYAAIAHMDNLAERAVQMEALADSNEGYAKTLFACMSGASGFYFPDTQQAFECRVQPL